MNPQSSKIQGQGCGYFKFKRNPNVENGNFFSTFACSALEGPQELEMDGMHFWKADTSQDFSLQNLK